MRTHKGSYLLPIRMAENFYIILKVLSAISNGRGNRESATRVRFRNRMRDFAIEYVHSIAPPIRNSANLLQI